jgi:phospholipid/cholesterol/gamma-HCH transport system substrate-binding protein
MSSALRRHSKPLAGLVYLAIIALLIMFSIATFTKSLPWQSAADITLRTTAPGLELNPHSDVKFEGLRVGEVRSITSDGRTATIELALDKDKLSLLPANVDAAIVPKTLFGEKFVDLRMPTDPEAARLQAGGTIAQSTTSVEIGAVFSDLVPVLQALQPQQLSIILNNLAQALDGRGVTLAHTLNQLQAFLVRLDPHVGTLTHDIGQFTKTANLYASSAPDLLNLLSSAAGISRELLVPKEQEFGSFLDQVGATTGEVKSVLAQNAQNLITLSGRSRPVLALLDQYSSMLPCTIKGLHTFDNLNTHAIGALGPFTNIDVEVVTNNTPYKNPVDLPSSPTSDGNNANLPAAIPGWAPHCPQFSAEVLAVKPAAPDSQIIDGLPINPSATPATAGTASAATAPPAAAVDEARQALARALAAMELGVPASQVPGVASLLVDPMLSSGRVTLP